MNIFFRITLVTICIGLTGPAFAAKSNSDANKVKNDASGAYHVIKKVKLGGDGSWDYLTIDGPSRRLYIGRSDRIMVVDIDADKIVGEIGDMKGVHGVTVVPELKKGFVTCGKEDLVRIFDLSTLKVTGQAATGKKPDASLYDPASKTVFAFNHGGTTATAIDPATGKVLAQIEIGGSAEFGVTDGKGKVYVNLEDKSQVAVIDSHKRKLLSTWPLTPGEGPTGLAIDVKHRRLFAGCDNQLMVVLDADTGKVINTLPIGKGVDAAGFDPISQNAFSSNGGDGTITVIHEKDSQTFAVLQNVQTQTGARTMALDPKTQQIWTVTATPKETPAAQTTEHRHREYVPDSFTAIIIGK